MTLNDDRVRLKHCFWNDNNEQQGQWHRSWAAHRRIITELLPHRQEAARRGLNLETKAGGKREDLAQMHRNRTNEQWRRKRQVWCWFNGLKVRLFLDQQNISLLQAHRWSSMWISCVYFWYDASVTLRVRWRRQFLSALRASSACSSSHKPCLSALCVHAHLNTRFSDRFIHTGFSDWQTAHSSQLPTPPPPAAVDLCPHGFRVF